MTPSDAPQKASIRRLWHDSRPDGANRSSLRHGEVEGEAAGVALPAIDSLDQAPRDGRVERKRIKQKSGDFVSVPIQVRPMSQYDRIHQVIRG